MASRDGNGWVRCELGHRHWGRFGAAGLLAFATAGPVLLQRRTWWSHHGGTWGLPGGARDSHESALAAALREAAEDRREEAITEAVREVVARQVEAGIDVVSDGDMSKPSYSTYIAERATGFGGSRKEPRRWLEAEDFPDWGGPKIEINLDPLPPAVPAVVGDIRRIDTGAAERDAANLAAAVTEAGAAEGFLTAASPGVLTIFMENQHYPSHDAYIEALIPVMREEYEAAYRAGLLVQIDSPDLSAFDVQFPGMPLDEWKRVAAAHVDAINAATAGIPPEAMRLHVCWGNH